MNRADIDNNHMIDRYVQGRLDGEALETFEVYMLDNPSIVDDIEYASGLQRAIRSSSELLVEGQTSKDETPIRQPLFGSQWAVAASVLLGISLFFNVASYVNTPNQSDLPQSNPIEVSNEIRFDRVRGGTEREGDSATTNIASGNLVNVAVDYRENDVYRIDLLDQNEQLLWSARNVRPANDQRLKLLLPALPGTGSYFLDVIADSAPTATTVRHRLVYEEDPE